jgi:hypothetical protein
VQAAEIPMLRGSGTPREGRAGSIIMATRPPPLPASNSDAQPRARTSAPRTIAPRLRQAASAKLPPTTSEQLVAVILRAGGRVLARHGHGIFIVIRRRLLFVPATHWLPEVAVLDALRLANLTDEQFVELRAAMH